MWHLQLGPTFQPPPPPTSPEMSSEGQLRPYQAKTASGQEAADALSADLEHAAARDVAQRKKADQKKQPKWMLPLGINLCVFAV